MLQFMDVNFFFLLIAWFSSPFVTAQRC